MCCGTAIEDGPSCKVDQVEDEIPCLPLTEIMLSEIVSEIFHLLSLLRPAIPLSLWVHLVVSDVHHSVKGRSKYSLS